MKLFSVLYDYHHPFDKFFPKAECHTVVTPKELSMPGILIIHGGQDVSPSLYNKGLSRLSHADIKPSPRDLVESTMIKAAKEMGMPIVGICRGAQLLCAVAGGYLIQHVNNHAGSDHQVILTDGSQMYVNSLHHQMMQPDKVDHEVLAVAAPKLSNVYWDENSLVNVDSEPEALYFNGLKGLAVQWHPEMMAEDVPANLWLKSTMEKYFGVS